MVIEDLLQWAAKTLESAGIDTPRLDAEVLLAHLLNKERLYLLLHRKETIATTDREHYEQLVARRTAHEPIAYLTGCREFMSLPFRVQPGVLIPRPDTETLVELVLAAYPRQASLTILDLCTGSGAIAVSLAYYLPQSRVTGLDISPICVETAKANAEQNGVARRVCVKQADILKPLPKAELFDCIVSNPPYIPSAVLTTLAPDVQNYEPHSALDGGFDGLAFYRHIVQTAERYLKPGGLLALETGHDQAEAVVAMMKETEGFGSTGIQCDLAGIGRVAYGRLKK